MPIYVYQAAGAASCGHCAKPFEVVQKLAERRLNTCPVCSAAVRRVITPPHVSRAGPSLAPDNLAKHGFTQYRRVGKGEYEKTAGKGPKRLSDKDDAT